MVSLEVLGKALDLATKDGKFGAAEHAAACDEIRKHYSPLALKPGANVMEIMADLSDTLARIGNISAIRQHGEKHGYVSLRDIAPDALASHVLSARKARLNGKG